MKFKCMFVVATLRKVSSMYISIETDSGHHRCAANFRKAWMITQQAIKDLSKRVYDFLTWGNAVNVIQFLAGLLFLLERLKNYFNFYPQPYLNMYI
ncbi:MAG: hypothetical protein Q7J31_10920 [Syntrophales bacterium]|nr:hypothetical protein [Syntrophales bacterium]